MIKKIIFLLITSSLIFSCSNKIAGIFSPETDSETIELTENEMAIAVYSEAVEALKKGDAYYAGKKFREVEVLLPQSKWAAKSSLLAAFSEYSRNSYSNSIFALERHMKKYPADKNIPYAHYLIAICYYEQILDEKKDLEPLLLAKAKFEFIRSKYPDTDYAVDANYKLDLIIDQLAAKEMYVARFYMKTKKWIPALNRLKVVINQYDKTVFVEEALHRLVEVYYKLGLDDEAKKAATILGYNYPSSVWYSESYKIFNTSYKPKKIGKNNKKESGLLKRLIKRLLD
jgi:outer membrane protein assembly factor BamD